jgi:crotonobetainyl-CoA:carnitine CoA-transferase CaiB-like acyl-CoA transferase
VQWSYGRGKRSVTLDAVDLDALALGADVLIECGAVPVDLDGRRAANPGLVTVTTTPFGESGPKAGWHATDLTVMAAAGPLIMAGDEDRAPVRTPVPQAFLHAGADAACGALMALAERARSGRGQHVSVSAQISVAQATQGMILAHAYGSAFPQRSGGGARSGPVRSQLVFPAGDGFVTVLFGFGSAIGPFSARLMDWVHETGFCDEETRSKDWIGYGARLASSEEPVEEFERVKACIVAFTSAHSKAELFEGARRRRVLLAPLSSPRDVLDSAQLTVRAFWDHLEVDGRCFRAPGPFAVASVTPLQRLGRAPRLGEHNGTIEHRPRPPAPPARPRRLPLAGIKVLDFSWAWAGPTITRALADFGATVVKVESGRRIDTARTIGPYWHGETGPETSGAFHNLNAGKLSVTVDLDTAGGRDVVLDLVRWADVVAESFSPRAMTGRGLGYDELRRANPSVIMLSTCLMGQTGPLADYAGFGNLAAAWCGFTELVGWPDRPPTGPFGAYTDYISPRLALATLLAALDHRRRTGAGQHLDVAQAEAALHFLAPALLDTEVNGNQWRRCGNDDDAMAPHGVYRARGDDRWVAVACENDEQWRRVAQAVGRGDLAGWTGAERLGRRRLLDDVIQAWTAERDAVAVQEELQALGVPAHAVQHSPDCAGDPQLRHLGHFVTVEHPELGPVELEGPRYRLSATPGVVGPPPALGQHVLPVLTGILGYDADRVSELLAAGALE